MENFSELIAVLLIVLGVIAKLAKKKKTEQTPEQKAKVQQEEIPKAVKASMPDKPVTPMPKAVAPANKLGTILKAMDIDVPGITDALTEMSEAKPEPAKREVIKPKQEVMKPKEIKVMKPVNAPGSLGGLSAEGVSSWSGDKLEPRLAAIKQETVSANKSKFIMSLNADSMRQAFVMSEVLDKPVSMRNSRR